MRRFLMLSKDTLDRINQIENNPEFITNKKKSGNKYKVLQEATYTFPTKPSREEMKQIFMSVLGWSEEEAEKASQDPNLIVRN